MNPSKLPHMFSSQQSFSFPSLSVEESIMLLKQPMIETPEKDRVFDPNELMTIDLIKTPEDIQASSRKIFTDNCSLQSQALRSDPSVSSKTAKLDLRKRMLCHEDFPRLLALSNQVKKAKGTDKNPVGPSTLDECELKAKFLKHHNGVNNFSISRGQCPLTDSMMQNYFTKLRYQLKAKTAAKTATKTEAAVNIHPVAPTRLFSSRMQPKTSPILASNQLLPKPEVRVEDVGIASPTFEKFKSPARGKKLHVRKKLFQKKAAKEIAKKRKDIEMKNFKNRSDEIFSMDNSASSMGTDAETTNEKKRWAEVPFNVFSSKDKKLQAEPPDPVKVPSRPKPWEHLTVDPSLVKPKSEPSSSFTYKTSISLSPTGTFATDIAITSTPHPFKYQKNNIFPPSEISAKYDEPLSDITARSTRRRTAFVRNSLGVSVAIPQVSLFPSVTRIVSSPDATATASQVILSNIDDAHVSTLGKPKESLISEHTNTVNENVKMNSAVNDTKSPHTLSVFFS